MSATRPAIFRAGGRLHGAGDARRWSRSAGLSGTGKSTLARALAPGLGAAPGAVLLRSDEERKRPLRLRAERALCRAGYTAAVTQTVYRTWQRRPGRRCEPGTASCSTRSTRSRMSARPPEDIAGDGGAEFVGIWLQRPEETLVARVESREADASDASAGGAKAVGFDPGEIAWARVDASGSADQVLERAAGAGRAGVQDHDS